ncbi:MAG TPA: IPT/TIG domain-containing protein [Candidatus Angelobacter sp.]
MANSTITITVTSAGAPSTPTVTLGSLPPGLSTTTTFPLSVPSSGASITLQAAANLATGSFNMTLNGQAGPATGTATVPVTVQSTPASFGFAHGLFTEVGVPIGGSGQLQFITLSNGSANDYDVVLSLSGLPPGTTATIAPPTIRPGQSPTVTITASGGAPVSQNAVVALTGTPQAPVPAATSTFLVDVTAPPGSLPDNRTDYVSTESSPLSAVYDSTHQLIFASNPSWNRVNVISAATHTILRTIPVQDSRGIDISQDNSRVWVGTGGHQIYEINTSTFTAIRHPLGGLALPSFFGLAAWEDNHVFALADGTVMLDVTINKLGSGQLFIWDPGSNAVTLLTTPGAHSFGIVQRSGDGKRIICFPGDSGGSAFFYDVLAKSFSSVFNIGGQNITGAVNFDGSRIVADLGMYDGNFNFIGALPGGSMGGPEFEGGTVFSADGKLLYEESLPDFTALILTIDPGTLNAVNVAPAMPLIPAGFQLSPPFFIPIPFAADSTGTVFGIEAYGIAFDDAAYTTNFSTLTPGSPTFLQHMSPYVGPLSGGTTSGGFGNGFDITPSVWYGANRGSAHVDSANDLTITSPPGSAPGPVNVKMLFPDGNEVFDPLFFSYGPFVQASVLSGASPAGGAPGQIAGFGLPASSAGGTLTVGGASAVITSSGPVRSIEFVDYPFPANTLNFTVPPGSPGYTDVTVTTPNGTSTLPRAMFYAASVTDFSSSDTFAAILYDGPRQQLYLSAGDHIDVFSLGANHFLAPLTPPAQGATKQFAGMALTPDGSHLLAADLLDGSLAVIDPDNPATATVIPVAPIDTSDPRCTRGPLYVAGGSNNKAYIVTGGLPAIGCGPGGSFFQVDLVANTSTSFSNFGCSTEALSGNFISSSSDGTKIAFNTCVYDATSNIFNGIDFLLNEQAISGDGNVAIALAGFLHPAFTDASASIIGRVALADVYFGVVYSADSTTSPLFEPKLNDAGSLLYQAYPPFVDIIDVQHGSLRLRFSLSETVSDVGVPMAIDSGGRHIYLITNRGLTVVDLGAAPLSIGSLSAGTASPGTTLTLRGSGFNSSTAATVGGQAAVVSFVDENTLMLTVPTVASGVANIVLQNNDGTSYTLENGLIVP